MLGHHRQLRPQVRQPVIGQRDAIQQDLALAGLVEARQQMYQGALAAAGAANKGDGLAGGNVDGNVMQYSVGIAPVGKRYTAHTDGAGGPGHLVAAVVRLFLEVELCKDILGGGQAPLYIALHLAQLADGLAQLGGGGEKCHQRTRRESAQDVGAEREPDQGGQRQRQQRLDDRRTEPVGKREFEVLDAVVLAGIAEALMLLALSAKEANFLVAADTLAGYLGHVPHGGLDAPAVTAEMPSHVSDDHGDDRDNRDKYQAQTPVEIEQVAGQGDHREPLAHHNFQCLGDGPGNLLHVEGDLGYERTLGVSIVIDAGGNQHLVEQLAAQPVNERAGDMAHAIVAHKKTAGPGRRQRHHRHRYRYASEFHPPQARVIEKAVGDRGDDAGGHPHGVVQGVEQELHQVGQQHIAEGINDVANQTQGEHRPLGRYIAEQAAVDLPVIHATVTRPAMWQIGVTSHPNPTRRAAWW